jgi:hypothetical protein
MNTFGSRSGSALIITLALVTLIALLVLGLLETSAIERAASASHLEGARAEFFANEGIDRVVATLRAVTTPPATGTTNYWISEPGQLDVVTSGGPALPNNFVQLSSGQATGASTNTGVTSYFVAPNLNVPSFTDTNSFLVTGDKYASGPATAMQLSWVYVRQSGTLDTSANPGTTSTTDPIIGRYAYWTDDESSKVNYNLAWTRNSTNAAILSSPTMVDLTALTNDLPTVDSLHSSITLNTNFAPLAGGFLNSRDDGQRVSPNIAAFISANYFDLTYYNNDPDMTFFNEPRIVLTTQQNRVPTNSSGNPALPFLDILTPENKDPGLYSNLDWTKVNTTINMLMLYLQRTDWPMASGASFQQKYYTGNTTRLAQLAIDIIDYVRCKESSMTAVPPLRVQAATSGTITTYANGASAPYTFPSNFLGTTRGPMITEAAVWIPGTTTGTAPSVVWNAQVVFEIFLPKNYGLASFDLTKLSVFAEVETPLSNPSSTVSVSSTEMLVGTTTLAAGQYAVVSQLMAIPVAAMPTRLQSVGLRLSLTPTPGGGRLTITPLTDGPTSAMSVIVDPATSTLTLSALHSVELNDPRIGQYSGDWLPSTPGPNTFGAPNSTSTLGKSGALYFYNPQQDTDGNGNLTDASLFMPPPAGTTYNGYTNTAGVVTSVGELGYVNTGVEGYGRPGVPWRTFRLQPTSSTGTAVPDWALMDVFTVPYVTPTNATSVFRPNGTSVGGRVNLNAQVTPFTNSFSRVNPLTALFLNSGTNSLNLANTMGLADAQTLAQNIAKGPLNGTLAANGKNYSLNNAYFSPGQIVEMQGVADRGEQSEEFVRQITSQMTVRSNTFTVYSIGQAIKQTTAGQLTITSQRRLEALVERYTDSATGTIRFRTAELHILSQ